MGNAERVAALHMIEPLADRLVAITLGADKGYDAEDFVSELRSMQSPRNVVQNCNGDDRDRRTHDTPCPPQAAQADRRGLRLGQTGQRKTRFRGLDRVGGPSHSLPPLRSGAAANALVRRPAKGKWRIVAMPDYTPDHPDMIEPTCIFFDGNGGGEFAFGCLTGTVHNAKKSAAFAFTWDGNEEMDRACGDGWAELRLTVPSRAKSASTAATKPTSLPDHGTLVQQPCWAG